MTNAFESFIPIGTGLTQHVKSQRFISDLLGQVGYEVRGKYVIYDKDLTALSPAINTVTMDLVVMDFTQFGEYDLIPIDASMEAQLVDMVYRQFAGLPQQTGVVETTNDSK